MAFKGALAGARRRIPEPDHVVIAGGRKKPARKGHGIDPHPAKSLKKLVLTLPLNTKKIASTSDSSHGDRGP
jgi:hypothetical protein